jgi:hypothetical protein
MVANKNRIYFKGPKESVSYGTIEYFNLNRKFGVIESSGQSFLFFPDSFVKYAPPEYIQKNVGKSVSFVSEEQGGRFLARKVEIL